MLKKYKYPLYGSLIGGAGFALINAIDQIDSNDKSVPFNWKDLLIAVGKGIALGAGIGFVAGAATDYFNSIEEPLDLDALFNAHLHKIRLHKTDLNYQLLKRKSDWLIEVLQNNFPEDFKLQPYRFGSTEHGTALKDGFDIDICLSFKPATFSSTKEMLEYVLTVLQSLKGTNGIIQVRKQKKSIGVFFVVNGNDMKIDVLPYQVSHDSKNDQSGYMCVNGGLFENPTRSKTDVQLLSGQKMSETQNKILISLKDWKKKTNLPINSHLLQNLIVKAYEVNKGHIPYKLTEKIIMVISFIEENLQHIRLNSIENTNNVLTKIPNHQKSEIIRACGEIIDDYEYQPNSIIQLIQ